MERIIGTYKGVEKGPVLVLLGAIHGNEHAGVEAIKMLFRELALEPYHNPTFALNGSVIGLIGNVPAYLQEKRYINKDLNRFWTDYNIASAFSREASSLSEEEVQVIELINTIRNFVTEVEPTEIYFLDIHTTSSNGGIFTIATLDSKSIELAVSLHAPVITGIVSRVIGTTIHFFNGENMGLPTTALAFEAGQHNDVLSPGRAYAAIVNFLKHIGCVRHQDVENRHDKILIEFSKNLPRVNKLIYKYSILDGLKFRMKPGFSSFDEISKGQHLADDAIGPVFSPMDGRILMPLYQSQGEDGFFIIKEATLD